MISVKLMLGAILLLQVLIVWQNRRKPVVNVTNVSTNNPEKWLSAMDRQARMGK